MSERFNEQERKVIQLLKEKYGGQNFLDMVTQVVQESIDFKEYFRRFKDLYGSDGYEYRNYNGDFRIRLDGTTYCLDKRQTCSSEFQGDVIYYDSYDTEERFNFKTGEWEDANGKKLILQGEKYKKKADMILKTIKELIKEKESELSKLVYQNRG